MRCDLLYTDDEKKMSVLNLNFLYFCLCSIQHRNIRIKIINSYISFCSNFCCHNSYRKMCFSHRIEHIFTMAFCSYSRTFGVFSLTNLWQSHGTRSDRLYITITNGRRITAHVVYLC